MATGKWIKVASTNEGINKITYNQLQSWGITSPQQVAVYSNGGYMLPVMNNVEYPDDLTKIPVVHSKDKDGKDAVFFYSGGTTSWEYSDVRKIYEHKLNLCSDKTYFFITSDHSKSEAPATKTSLTTTPSITVDYFDNFQLYEQENINIHNMGNVWYSDRIMQSMSKTVNFSFPNVVTTEKATVTLSGGAASSSKKSYHHIELNNLFLNSHGYFAKSLGNTKPSYSDFEFWPSNDLSFKITYETEGPSGDSWLDYLVVNLKSKLKLDDSQLTFRNSQAKNYGSIAFTIETNASNLKIWEVTNPLTPVAITYTQNAGNISFTGEGFSIRNYVVFDSGNGVFGEPVFVEEIKNQNLHALPSYEMIIVTHPDFIKSSETLAEFHRQNDRMKVLVVNLFDIYNEFSSGLPDVSGIRNMVKMFYDRGLQSATPLKYLLLMGDGSYDNRRFGGSKSNFIPTYQTSFLERNETYMSDDFFGILSDQDGGLVGDLMIGVGRMPCQTKVEADIVVNKSINYVSPETMGDWRNIIALLADDEDGNQYMDQSEGIAKIVNDSFPGFYFDKIYFDAYRQLSTASGDFYPDVTKAINNRVDNGALILNYIGHANEIAMAHEKVLEISDINKWSNINKLPIFVTATCSFSRFDDDKMSAGENILFNPAGGAVALFSTTRLVYSGSNYVLTKNFYRYVFRQDEKGNNLRMGDIMRLAKNATGDNYNKRSFSLLGDPALRLAFPRLNVQTKSINGHLIGDTIAIGALGKVMFEGEVTDRDGQVLSQMNGKVNVTVYDKTMIVETMDNDGEGKFSYPVQNNTIYKGTATVTNGLFNYSFIVPKDITYNLGKGRILYYFSNDTIDGNGSTDEFLIGGTSDNPIVDNTPPEIEAYLNNYNFKSNDKVSSSALLMLNLFDESGINTVGTGIGHDIVAILDDDYSNVFVLNDFYVSDPDTYQSGKVVYPLNNLSPGLHTLEVKVWDVQNNSTTKEIMFIVEEGFEITAVNNFPNPVQFYTTFNAVHNLPGDVFQVKVEIFNLRGVKVHEIDESIGSYGTTEISVRWDVAETNYRFGNDRLLIYRITMHNQEGLVATGAGKLLMNIF